MGADQFAVRIIDVEAAGQLVRRGFDVEAAIGSPLLFGQEADGHTPPLLGGGVETKFCDGSAEPRFSGEVDLQKYAAKPILLQALLPLFHVHEDR
jgi:hypothetical protein